MAKSESTTEAKSFHENRVVDVDVHVSYRSPEIMREAAKHLSEPYKSRFDPEHGSIYSSSKYMASGVPRTTPGKSSGLSVTDPIEDVQKPLCDDFGVDYPIVNVLLPFGRIFKTERAIQEMRAANDIILERFLDEHDHFRGLASVALQKPDVAAEELDRLGSEDQIVGVIFFAGESEKPLGDPRYDPVYEAAQDNDLTCVYHGGGGCLQRGAPIIHQDTETYIEVHSLTHPWSQMLSLSSLIAQGVPEKFPDLTFVMLEAGIGWVPYMMARLNREYGQHRYDAPLLEQSPEEYIRDRFYFGTQPVGEFNDPTHMQQMIDLVGPELLLFCTDYPHQDFDHPNAIDTYLDRLDEADQDKILHGNASEAFSLGL
jgi:predicted TIM-barrel fold metal-dependent hydrolase